MRCDGHDPIDPETEETTNVVPPAPLDAAESAALIGAGLLSVLVFPVLGLAVLRGPVTHAPLGALPGDT